jgi:hypothetical protein
MARITVENYKRTSTESDRELHIEAVVHHSPSGIAASLHRYLNAAKAMWPDSPELKKLHIVELDK